MKVLYTNQLELPQWHLKREEILKRDSYRCRACGSAVSLQVHHRQYHIDKKTGEYVAPWKYNNKYLITLCNKCHTGGHLLYRILSYSI